MRAKYRFNELRRAIPGVTQHMLTAQLRDLEKDGFVRRTIDPEVPPRVEYEMTDEARCLRPVFEVIFTWASERTSTKRPAVAEEHTSEGASRQHRSTTVRLKASIA
jgi:DNA-binding HxlR family transcriptional regulator